MTPEEIEVLENIVPLRRDEEPQWMRPMDVGGHNGSHHSRTLMRLAEQGLVEATPKPANMQRGARNYRITPAGIDAYEALHGPRPTRAEWDASIKALSDVVRAKRLLKEKL